MIKDGELSFKTQWRIDVLPPNNGNQKCFEKSLHRKAHSQFIPFCGEQHDGCRREQITKWRRQYFDCSNKVQEVRK